MFTWWMKLPPGRDALLWYITYNPILHCGVFVWEHLRTVIWQGSEEMWKQCLAWCMRLFMKEGLCMMYAIIHDIWGWVYMISDGYSHDVEWRVSHTCFSLCLFNASDSAPEPSIVRSDPETKSPFRVDTLRSSQQHLWGSQAPGLRSHATTLPALPAKVLW